MKQGGLAGNVGGQTGETDEGRLPDFLLIGAQRSGTTLFYELLCRHPDVARAQRKEVHYFDRDYGKGEGHYRAFFPKEGGRTTGEATPYYLYHPGVPKRARALVPHVSLVVLLRNPVDRAYSHWRFQVALGNEHLGFGEALRAEESRLAGAGHEDRKHRIFSYAARGLYAPQLEKWIGEYGRDPLLVVEAESFFRDPAPEIARAHAHIGLDPAAAPPLGADWARRATRNASVSVPGEDGPMRAETRRDLEALFAPRNEDLFGLLGERMAW